MESKLSARLQAGLKAWTDYLEEFKDSNKPEFDSDTNPLMAHKSGGDPEIKVSNIIFISYIICTSK